MASKNKLNQEMLGAMVKNDENLDIAHMFQRTNVLNKWVANNALLFNLETCILVLSFNNQYDQQD